MDSKDSRTRNWTFVVYPESAPENWIECLKALCVPFVVSPLHDMDLEKDGSGALKKAHWHVLILFKGKKSYNQVKTITEAINATTPQICHDATGLVRYFAHLDNPDKYQYSTSDIQGFCGADPSEYLKPTSGERHQIINEMMQFVRDNHVIEFQDLCDYARENKFDTWFSCLCDNSTIVMERYVRSQRHRFGGK